jgi:hypothetical protein
MGSRKHVGFTKLHLVSCAVFLIVLSGLAPLIDAAAPVRLGGRVQGIAGGKMAVIPDSGKVSVTVDLTRVPVDQYQGLKQGDGVVVEGVLSEDGRTVMGTAVMAAGGWGDRVPTSVPPRGPSPYPPDPR